MVINSDVDNDRVVTVNVEREYMTEKEMGCVGLTREESGNNLCSYGGTAQRSLGEDFVEVNGVRYPPFTPETWIGDIGSSCHIDNSPDGLFDASPIKERVAGIGGNVLATLVGKKRYCI